VAASGLELTAANAGGEGGEYADAEENDQAVMLASAELTASHGIYVWVKDTVKFILGAVLVLISVPALWFYERQKARSYSLFSTARSSCTSLSGAKASPEHCGVLTHITGWQTRPTAAVRDPRFPGVVLKEGCVRLRTGVQVYQPLERRSGSSQKPELKGSVREGWSEVEHRMPNQEGPQRSSVAPPGLRMGTTVTNCGHVDLGPGFTLPDALVDQCRNFKPVDHLLDDAVTTDDGKLLFKRHDDGHFYCRHGVDAWSPKDVAEAPRLGDARVLFEHVAPGPVTVLALQVDATGGDQKMTFSPFRLISRGLCGLNEEEEKLALKAQARKSREMLAREDQCLPGSSICCGCNLMSRCYTGVMTPEIFCLFDGTRSADDALRGAEPTRGWNTLIVRLLLYIVMTVGYAFVVVAIDVAVPWLRDLPIAAVLGFWGRPGFCVLFALFTWVVLVLTAYLAFRPLAAICSLVAIAMALVVPNLVALATGSATVLLEPPPRSGSVHASGSFLSTLYNTSLSQLRGVHRA